MSMRLRRLQADYQKLQLRCDSSPYLLIRSTKGNPPERYEIAFSIKGLSLDSKNQIVEATDHVAEIVLTSGYPRQAPQCKMLVSVVRFIFRPTEILLELIHTVLLSGIRRLLTGLVGK